jgi:hypothetical protein
MADCNSLDDGGMNLQNLIYTPNTVKLSVSEQTNSSFSRTGDLPSEMLYDFPPPGEWTFHLVMN